MRPVLGTPQVEALGDVVAELRDWQSDDAVFQLHPGDIGWFWRFGPEKTAAALRTWRRDGRMLAIGLLDGADLLRLTIAPDARDDLELAGQLAADISEPSRGVLPAGEAYLEAPIGARVRDLLSVAGWHSGEPWTGLQRALADAVEDPGVRIEIVDPELASVRVALQRASFPKSGFAEESWFAMATGVPYANARCLIAYDGESTPVATITVWSAGPGRPGLIEPMGVDSAYRGLGYGTAITLAGAAALRELGSSSAVLATPSANIGGVATYRAAGFEPLPERLDLTRAG